MRISDWSSDVCSSDLWSKDSVESHAVFGAKPKKPITAAHPLYSRSECAPRRQSPGGRQFGAAGQGIATPPDARPAPVQSQEAIRPACGNYRHGNAPLSGTRSVPTLWREHWRAYKRTAPRWSACDTNQPRKARSEEHTSE